MCLASMLLPVIAYAAPQANDATVKEKEARRLQQPGGTRTGRVEVVSDLGRPYVFHILLDSTVADVHPISVEKIAEKRGAALIFVDTYRSRAGGMSYCQAGEERFLRVFSIAQAPPRETYRVKLESCRQNIELASPGVEWVAESSTLNIHWLLGPKGDGVAENRVIRIGSKGKVDR
jgi:hypothetical protein